MEKTTPISCNESTLTPYIPFDDNPWNTTKIKHVYRRLGFGASQDAIDAALSLSPNDFIDNLVAVAINNPPTTSPFWSNYELSEFTNFEEENEQYIQDWKIQTGVPFYAVSIDKKQDAPKVAAMAKKSDWSFSVLLDKDKKLRKALGVWTVSLTLVIKNNKIVYRQIGYSNGAEKKLYQAIKKHTADKKYASL